MPTCKKCGNHFANREKVEGKVKSLSSRKYCLTCSPWGKHNTKSIEKQAASEPPICICRVCSRKYIYKRSAGHTMTKCNSCMANLRRHRVKSKAIAYKGGKCKLCGYNRCERALDFHHVNESEKDFDISGSHCRKWVSIKTELDKCILLCRNCHSEVHEGIVPLLRLEPRTLTVSGPNTGYKPAALTN